MKGVLLEPEAEEGEGGSDGVGRGRRAFFFVLSCVVFAWPLPPSDTATNSKTEHATALAAHSYKHLAGVV